MTPRIMSENLVPLFNKHFGHAPHVVGSAPGRVNLIGEHIDYTEGWVLPFAIGYRAEVAISRRDDSHVVLVSAQKPDHSVTADLNQLAPDKKRGWAEYVLGVVAELGVTTGLNIVVDGNVPLGAGLSSSAALECATAIALNELLDLNKTREELALACQAAENNFVGMPCGIMDQAVSMLAHQHHAVLLDCKSLETQHIPLELEAAGLALLVTDTRAHHSLVDGGYAARRASLEHVCDVLKAPSLRDVSLDELAMKKSELSETDYRRATHAITEIARVHKAVVALEKNDFERLGTLLNESHTSLRDNYTVSCPELDAAVDAANAVGALGSRMVGGGFGGSAIALIPTAMLTGVRKSIADLFRAAGFQEPRFFVATANEGAFAITL
ncbi:MAG: hypothetical protein RL410_111 [Actinomycetota bacterium]|jgi:galactokinase